MCRVVSLGWMVGVRVGRLFTFAPLQRAAAQPPASASPVSPVPQAPPASSAPPPVFAAPSASDLFNQPAAYDPPPGTALPYSGTSVMRGSEFVPVTSDVPLIAGDRLRTASGGSAMIVMIEHSVVFVSEESEIEMRGPQRLRVLRGHAVAMVEDWPRVLSVVGAGERRAADDRRAGWRDHESLRSATMRSTSSRARRAPRRRCCPCTTGVRGLRVCCRACPPSLDPIVVKRTTWDAPSTCRRDRRRFCGEARGRGRSRRRAIRIAACPMRCVRR